MSLRKSVAGLILTGMLIIVVCSCKENGTPESTFDQLQSKILTPSCAISGCHASKNDVTFSQHELILEKNVAYANLVNIRPKNTNAQADGLLRVKPGEPEKSLFIHKLHLYDHHMQDYGNPMPLGLTKLSMGQLEFIEQWINAGAPKTGIVADASLLADEVAQTENFVPLAPPDAGKGFQINISKFSVSPFFEREFFVYKYLGNTQEIFVNRFEINMRMNSHHFVLYDFNSSLPPNFIPQPDVVRDIRNLDGSLNSANMFLMAYHVYVVGSQSPYLNYEFPPGVALRMGANMSLDFNSHYVNKEPTPIDGEVNINFHTTPQASVVKEAKTLNLNNTIITLKPNQRTVISKSFTMSSDISVIALTSHTHQLGEKFVIKIIGGTRNGEIVYTSTDWHHPQFVKYDPPLVLHPGEGLKSEITYNNTKSQTVSFGLTSEDEMGIIFGYYTLN
ncbi:MAG TPA: hypothetical protein PLR06_03765 [Cyclobacteriaceae bacterium]|nr:hypothetical protein [Cyclobacteriaceae bacterium]